MLEPPLDPELLAPEPLELELEPLLEPHAPGFLAQYPPLLPPELPLAPEPPLLDVLPDDVLPDDEPAEQVPDWQVSPTVVQSTHAVPVSPQEVSMPLEMQLPDGSQQPVQVPAVHEPVGAGEVPAASSPLEGLEPLDELYEVEALPSPASSPPSLLLLAAPPPPSPKIPANEG